MELWNFEAFEDIKDRTHAGYVGDTGEIRIGASWLGVGSGYNVTEFSNHDKLGELLLDVRMQEFPTGYQRVSMKQLEAADKKFFVLMGEETQSGIKASQTGRPCDSAFDKVFNSAGFRYLLHPRMAQVGTVTNEVTSAATDPPPKQAKTGPKGKGQGKTTSTFQRIPTDLLKLGAVGTTPKGNRLCFGFNLKSCNGQVSGQKCERGLHLRCIKGCMKPHPAVECPNKKGN